MKTGNVKVPGALIATDKKGVVAYAGDINDEVTRILNEEESIVEASQHEINLELISWKDTMTKRDPENPDLDNYYTISEIDNLLNSKIGLSNIILQAYKTEEGQIVSNVDFNRNTVADYTTIPSMDVFKKFVPQIHDSHEIEYAISSYGSGVFESQIGLSSNKIPTIGSVIDLINASNDLYIPPLINDSGDYTHLTLTQAVFSASYIDNAVFGAGGYGEFPKSSMKSYVDDLSTRIFTINVTTSIGNLSTASISNSQEDIANIITGIEEACRNNLPFIVAIKVADGVLIGNVNMLEFDYTNISAHSNQYDIYIHLSNDNYTTTSVTMKRADVSKAESEKCILVLEDVNDNPQFTNQFNRRSSTYENIGVLDAYDIFRNNGLVSLKYEDHIYSAHSIWISPDWATSDSVVVNYLNFNTDKRIHLNISEENVQINVYSASEYIRALVLTDSLAGTRIWVVTPTGEREEDLATHLHDLYYNKVDEILIGGSTAIGSNDEDLGRVIDLTTSLKQFCIWDDKAAMLAKLQNLNTSAADAYKYDFSGEGNYNAFADFDAYEDLRDNLVLEVNGLRKKLANIDVGTTYATQNTLNTLANKVYAGLYGNNTGTNTLGDTTKLQSLKAVVDWLGLKSSIGDNLGAYITDVSGGIYQTITGSNESVLYLSKTQGNSGLQFVPNLDSLGHILCTTTYREKDSETSYTAAGANSMNAIIDNDADGWIMTAGAIERLVSDITGITYSHIASNSYTTIDDRLDTLELFKGEFETEGIEVHELEGAIETINDLTDSIIPLLGTLPFNDFLTSEQEANVDDTNAYSGDLGTGNAIYYSKTYGCFVMKKNSTYYTTWGTLGNVNSSSVYNASYANRGSLYYNITEKKLYPADKITNDNVLVTVSSNPVDLDTYLNNLSSLLPLVEEDIVTGATIQTGTTKTNTTSSNVSNGVLDLSSLASIDYVDDQIAAISPSTPEGNFATQTYVNNYVDNAVSDKIIKVKIGTLEADVNTTPGTAAFTVNTVKTALFGTANVLTSNSSISWNKISFEGVTNPPITNITDDNIPPTIARKSDITITGIKRNGAAVSPSNNVVDLGYTITGIRVSPRVVSNNPQLSNPTGTILYPASGNYTDGSNIPKTILDLAAWFHPKDPIFTISINGSSKDYSPSLEGFDLGENYIQGTILDDDSVDFWTKSITENSTYEDEGISYGDINNYLVTAQTIKSICDSIKGAISNITPSGGDASIPINNLSSTVLAEPNRVYKASTPLSALNIALQAPNNDNTNPKAAIYTFRFTTGSTFSGLKLKIVASNAINTSASGLTNMNILYPYDITWNTNTSYEVSILYDGSSYSLKQVALQSTNTQDNTGYITIG